MKFNQFKDKIPDLNRKIVVVEVCKFNGLFTYSTSTLSIGMINQKISILEQFVWCYEEDFMRSI